MKTIVSIIVVLVTIGLLVFFTTRTKPTDSPINAQLNYQTNETAESVAPTAPPTETQPIKSMQTATVKTNMGTFVIKLDTENTPNTAANFAKLANAGFYNGTRFHRIIAGFMIQGGDPQSADLSKRSLWGTGGPGYQFADEIKPTNNNAKYTISMANSGPNTNGSQFFINVADNSFLNPKHTVFGTVTSGTDVVQKISEVKTGASDQPVEDVIVESIVIS